MVDDQNDNQEFSARVTRREILKDGLKAGALAALAGMAGEAEAANKFQPKAMQAPAAPKPEQPPAEPKERFTLPPGKEAKLNFGTQFDPRLYNLQALGNDALSAGARQVVVDEPAAKRILIGVNMPVGARRDLRQLIMDGGSASELLSDFRTGRMLETKHFHKPDTQGPDKGKGSYLLLGARKVFGVEPGSVVLMVELRPGHRLALNNMPGTKFEAEGKLDVQRFGTDPAISNTGTETQKLMLIIPPSEYKFLLGGKLENALVVDVGRALLQAEDLETIRKGMQLYSSSSAKEIATRYPGMNIKDAKVQFLEELKTKLDETYDSMKAELRARIKNPKKEHVYSDEEVKAFHSAWYKEAGELGILTGKPAAAKTTAKKPAGAKKPAEEKPTGLYFDFKNKFDKDKLKSEVLESMEEHSALVRPQEASFVARQERRDLLDQLNKPTGREPG